MLRIIIYILTAIILLVGYIKYIESRSVFFPTQEIQFSPQVTNLSFEDIYIETEDKLKINGWFIPHSNAGYTLLLFHGNGGNIQDRLDKIYLLHRMGLNIFIIDYRGYGRSQGRPNEAGIYLDAWAAYNYLIDKRNISPKQIILYGESLGCAVAVDLAFKVKIKGLILEGSFSKGRDMARRIYPFLPSFLFSNRFDSLAKIKAVNAPKLFIHSQNDEIVPIDLARKLYNTALEPKHFVEILGSHNTAFLDSQEAFLSAVASFIKDL